MFTLQLKALNFTIVIYLSLTAKFSQFAGVIICKIYIIKLFWVYLLSIFVSYTLLELWKHTAAYNETVNLTKILSKYTQKMTSSLYP